MATAHRLEAFFLKRFSCPEDHHVAQAGFFCHPVEEDLEGTGHQARGYSTPRSHQFNREAFALKQSGQVFF
jgi:hypothetical protein